jgi:hypothetical protein
MTLVLLCSRSPIFGAAVDGWTLTAVAAGARKHRIAIESRVAALGGHAILRERVGRPKLNGLVAAGFPERGVDSAR